MLIFVDRVCIGNICKIGARSGKKIQVFGECISADPASQSRGKSTQQKNIATSWARLILLLRHRRTKTRILSHEREMYLLCLAMFKYAHMIILFYRRPTSEPAASHGHGWLVSVSPSYITHHSVFKSSWKGLMADQNTYTNKIRRKDRIEHRIDIVMLHYRTKIKRKKIIYL